MNAVDLTPGSDLTALTPEMIEEIRDLAKRELFFFAQGILGYTKLTYRIHGPICELLQNYETNQNLRIILPRGWYKTTLCSIAYPIWRAIRDCNIRVLIVQNTETNAIGKLSSINDQFMQNSLFRALFPELMPTKDQEWTKTKMTVPRTGIFPEGTFEGAGIRTKVVSRHYNLIIEDDTVSPDLDELGEENLAPTKEDIAQAIGWHRLSGPLLTELRKDQQIIVGTRWFEKDLLSWNMENEPHYKGYHRACREDADGNPAEDGVITFEEEFPLTVLDRLKHSLGPYMFSCLYLNKPMRTDDMMFRLEWFKYYSEIDNGTLMYFTTVDPAGAPDDSKGEPDWNTIITCAVDIHTGEKYVIETSRGKWNPAELLDCLFEKHIKVYHPFKVGIEAVAYQKALLYYCRERMTKSGLWVDFVPITHGRQSKATRIMGLVPAISSGELKFRRHHSALITELLGFPYAKHDDLADALAMQHTLWQTSTPRGKRRRVDNDDDPFSMENLIEQHKESRSLGQKSNLVKDLYGVEGGVGAKTLDDAIRERFGFKHV